MIKLVRIDYRLLHGQVVFSWSKQLNIGRIIVIDDDTATDEFKKMSLSLSKPAGAKLNIFTLKEALSKISKIEALTENVMIIMGNTATALAFCQNYPKIKEINYGVLPQKEGATQYSAAIYLNEAEVQDSIELKKLGIELFMQQVPTSKRELLNNRI
ncbi:TPA: PTS sugar transporter subunit IIB [Streptococcus suis]|uniref:PTS system sorbose subfamily transporter subunit IIB n=1 Tax=Streptococcus suis TaxID=1307 RepID=A0A0Z8UPH2_STRSU|nr:PTS sugar transporter subunit IIB [Streptococcus suis]NQH24128.1 PTS sugar transporter subunit IIB [Streptococcus suis]NQH64628.1 PTS sugar transporter subunit IIB [Streptococcus suis]NQN39223.1 PTS sugar transporter subunit IIB [Streptococcus suis]NQP21949.1 PTS sugar transporter subunit IIB [Streptococcus suis]NQP31293.1 PTS sugar transporter subunit IIB [Streptococcus suis]